MADTPGQGQAGHRRRVGAVTSNACTECRKKRSKCDGQTPCSRCRIQNATCVYETLVRQTKDEMRSEIEDLRNHKAQTEQIIEALRGDTSEEVLSLIRSEKPVLDIYRAIETGKTKVGLGYRTTWKDPRLEERIKSASKKAGFMVAGGAGDGGGRMSQLSIATRFQNQNAGDVSLRTSASDASPLDRPFIMAWSRSPSSGTVDEHRVYGQQQLLGAAFSTHGERAEQEEIPDTWTYVSDDPKWVYHLMTLYFCWEYPTFASLSKDYFLEDFSAKRRRYCSPLLVNAMLALGCRFSTLPEARADPNDPSTAGDHFFAEAKKLLAAEKQMDKLANIQALGLMAIREGSCGRDTESFYYAQLAIRIAVEIGLHKDQFPADIAEREVRAATFWGAFTLDQAWSLSLSKMPHLSINVRDFPRRPSIRPSSEMAPWLPYTDYGVPQHIAANQPCNVHSVYECFCELSMLIHSALYTLYSPQKRFTSQDLIHHYQTYMNWYDEMPEVLKLGSNFTPSVLFVHMYYHYASISLFLPFINLRLACSDFVPSVICATSAEAITTIITFYRDLYTLNHTPSMTPYLILMSTIAHLKSPHSDMDKLRGSIEALREMCQCHGFASRALEIVKYLAGKWGVRGVYPDGESDDNLRRDWDAVKPRANSTNLFVPRGTATGGDGQAEDDVLFSVFPLQGLPLIGCGEELERDGFYIPGPEESGDRDERFSGEHSGQSGQPTPGSISNTGGGGQSGPPSNYGGGGDYGMHGASN